MRYTGIALVLVGFIALIWGGVPYKKTENIAEIGGLKMQVTEKKEMSIPPWASGIAILAGAVMIFQSRKQA